MMTVVYDWQTKARMFICKQRIKELENAIKYWPHSERLEERKAQLASLQEDLREYEIGYK